MDLTWRFFFSIYPTSLYIKQLLISVIFLQCGIEEAQLALQYRDEVIHQVGTETSVQGSVLPKRFSQKFFSLEFIVNILPVLCPSLFEYQICSCMFVIEKLAVKELGGNSRRLFLHHKGEGHLFYSVRKENPKTLNLHMT